MRLLPQEQVWTETKEMCEILLKNFYIFFYLNAWIIFGFHVSKNKCFLPFIFIGTSNSVPGQSMFKIVNNNFMNIYANIYKIEEDTAGGIFS